MFFFLQVFRNQSIDGWCLSRLTESHLTSKLNMKLGPALKLLSILSTKYNTGGGYQKTSPQQSSTCYSQLGSSEERFSPNVYLTPHHSPTYAYPSASPHSLCHSSESTPSISRPPSLHIDTSSPSSSDKL